MANYKNSEIVGESWQRACRVVIENPYGEIPSIQFAEEKMFLIDNEMIPRPLDRLSETMSDPTMTFPLINPSTGEVLGTTASYQDVYIMLHSLYISLAVKRDQREL
jgi:hypothetical protein